MHTIDSVLRSIFRTVKVPNLVGVLHTAPTLLWTQAFHICRIIISVLTSTWFDWCIHSKAHFILFLERRNSEFVALAARHRVTSFYLAINFGNPSKINSSKIRNLPNPQQNQQHPELPVAFTVAGIKSENKIDITFQKIQLITQKKIITVSWIFKFTPLYSNERLDQR